MQLCICATRSIFIDGPLLSLKVWQKYMLSPLKIGVCPFHEVTTTYKTRTNPSDDTLCRLCGKAVESLEHVLAGCLALAQNKYLARHNAALKVLFFEMLRDQN